MTVFLVLIVIILFAVTLWQMSKIYALSKGKSKDVSGEVANDKDNSVNAKLMIITFRNYDNFLGGFGWNMI